MSVGANVVVSLGVSVGASSPAWQLKRRLDDANGIEVVGWTMSLMVANILQLFGIVVQPVGIFE